MLGFIFSLWDKFLLFTGLHVIWKTILHHIGFPQKQETLANTDKATSDSRRSGSPIDKFKSSSDNLRHRNQGSSAKTAHENQSVQRKMDTSEHDDMKSSSNGDGGDAGVAAEKDVKKEEVNKSREKGETDDTELSYDADSEESKKGNFENRDKKYGGDSDDDENPPPGSGAPGNENAFDGGSGGSPLRNRPSPFMTGSFAEFMGGSMFGFGFPSQRQEYVHLVFPDDEESSSGDHPLIKIVHPIDYHKYPDKAPTPNKEGPHTERNRDKDPPGLVESTVEDTTPRDARGRWITPPYPVNYTCKWCGKKSLYMLVCRGCKIARYCQDQCQDKHWCFHRHQCFNDPENAVDVHDGETLEVEIFMDSEDELRYEPEERKEELRAERREEKERMKRLMDD